MGSGRGGGWGLHWRKHLSRILTWFRTDLNTETSAMSELSLSCGWFFSLFQGLFSWFFLVFFSDIFQIPIWYASSRWINWLDPTPLMYHNHFCFILISFFISFQCTVLHKPWFFSRLFSCKYLFNCISATFLQWRNCILINSVFFLDSTINEFSYEVFNLTWCESEKV